MKRTVFMSMTTLGLLFFSCGLFAQSAEQIRKKAADVVDLSSMTMDFTINIRDGKGSERVRQLTMITGRFNDVTKTLIRFTAPSDVKGTALLIFDYEEKEDDMWIYMPALKKVRRIISSEKGKSFMGSEFTNADMSKPNHADFHYELKGSETYEGRECWIVQEEGKDQAIKKANGYSRSVNYIDKETYLCYKTEYYDSSDNLHRVMIASDFKKITATSYFAYHTSMENVKNGRISEMVVNNLETGKKYREDLFSPNALQ